MMCIGRTRSNFQSWNFVDMQLYLNRILLLHNSHIIELASFLFHLALCIKVLAAGAIELEGFGCQMHIHTSSTPPGCCSLYTVLLVIAGWGSVKELYPVHCFLSTNAWYFVFYARMVAFPLILLYTIVIVRKHGQYNKQGTGIRLSDRGSFVDAQVGAFMCVHLRRTCTQLSRRKDFILHPGLSSSLWIKYPEELFCWYNFWTWWFDRLVCLSLVG